MGGPTAIPGYSSVSYVVPNSGPTTAPQGTSSVPVGSGGPTLWQDVNVAQGGTGSGPTVGDANARAAVAEVYHTALGREPDAAGLDQQVKRYQDLKGQGMSDEDAKQQLYSEVQDSPEYQASHQEDAKVIDGAYQQMLGRPADAGGIKALEQKVDEARAADPKADTGRVITDFIQSSDEYLAAHAPATAAPPAAPAYGGPKPVVPPPAQPYVSPKGPGGDDYVNKAERIPATVAATNPNDDTQRTATYQAQVAAGQEPTIYVPSPVPASAYTSIAPPPTTAVSGSASVEAPNGQRYTFNYPVA